MDIAAIKEALLDGLKIGELVRDFVPESDMADTKAKIGMAAVSTRPYLFLYHGLK